MVENNKIPVINDKFDLALFLHILKKSSIWIILILTISLFVAFTYLRYTPPVYESKSVIQINFENKTEKLLNLATDIKEESNNLNNVLELLRSTEFLKRAFIKLPLKTSYYSKGTFLSTELYKSSPFNVSYNIKNTSIYGIPIYVMFINKTTFKIFYTINNKKYTYLLKTDKWFILSHFEINLSILDYELIKEQQEAISSVPFYFIIINNPDNIVEENSMKLAINIQNQAANTIQITFTDNDPVKTSDVVNTIAEEFLIYDIEKKKESAQNILLFIEEQLKNVYKNLDETEKQLHQFKKSSKSSLIASKSLSDNSPFPLFTAKLEEFENEISHIEISLLTLNRLKKEITDIKSVNIYELIGSLSGTDADSYILSILNNIKNKEGEKDELLNNVTQNNYKIKIIEKQILKEYQLLNEFIESSIKRLTDKKSEYKKKIAEYESKLFSESPYEEVEYSKLQRLYEINEGFYHKLIEKKAEYMISQAGFVSKNVILEKANIPSFRIAPSKKKTLLLSLLIGFLLSSVIVLIRYLLHNEIVTANDITDYTDVPLIGAIPKYKEEVPVSQLLVHKKTNSLFTESFRTLRSNLEFISHEEGAKVIAISSTISGEGKTFVTVNLAGIMALSGKKVILLDLDLRKPRIHLSFESENTKGVSTILINKHSIEECIKCSPLKNFDYITSGPIPPNPSELALTNKFDKFLEELKKQYDIIVIDTPPIGVVSDALNCFVKCDYPIYVIKANFSKRNFINNINHLVKVKNIHKLAIVINSIELQISKYGYGYSYGYRYGGGYYEEDQTMRHPESFWKKLSLKIKKYYPF